MVTLADPFTNGSSRNAEDALTDARHDHLIKTAQPTYDCSKDTVWVACWWALDLINKDHMPEAKQAWAHNRISALKMFMRVKIDQVDEEGGRCPTVDWVLENLDKLMTLWRNRYHNTSKTPSTYQTRIRVLLTAYKERCTDPKFDSLAYFAKADKADGAPSKAAKLKKPAKAAEEAAAPAVGPNTIQIPMGVQVARIDLPIPTNEMTFDQFTALVLGFSAQAKFVFGIKDVKQLVGRLASQASDYDFERGLSEQLFVKPTAV